MMILRKPEFGRIGVLTAEDGTPWFNAVDVCRVLDLKNPSQTLRDNVDKEDLRITETLTSGGMQKVNFVDDVDVRITDTKQNGKLRKVNFVDEADLRITETRSGGQVLGIKNVTSPHRYDIQW